MKTTQRYRAAIGGLRTWRAFLVLLLAVTLPIGGYYLLREPVGHALERADLILRTVFMGYGYGHRRTNSMEPVPIRLVGQHEGFTDLEVPMAYMRDTRHQRGGEQFSIYLDAAMPEMTPYRQTVRKPKWQRPEGCSIWPPLHIQTEAEWEVYAENRKKCRPSKTYFSSPGWEAYAQHAATKVHIRLSQLDLPKNARPLSDDERYRRRLIGYPLIEERVDGLQVYSDGGCKTVEYGEDGTPIFLEPADCHPAKKSRYLSPPLNNGRRVLFACHLPGLNKMSGCNAQTILGSLKVTYIFRSTVFDRWREIDRLVLEFVESLIIKERPAAKINSDTPK